MSRDKQAKTRCISLLLDHGFSRKGPKNSASSVPSFIRSADISRSAHQNFLIFCTELEQHKCRKVTFSDFRKKLLTFCGWGHKVKFAHKLDFCKNCFRTVHQNFSIFCMKLDNNKAFQTMYILSSGKLLGSKGQILGPKLTFSKISSEPHDTFFLHEVRH